MSRRRGRRRRPRRVKYPSEAPSECSNPNGYTRSEVETAKLLISEGYPTCYQDIKRYKGKIYRYPRMRLGIGMCDREALEPASKVFGTRIIANREKKIRCPPHLFPRWKRHMAGGNNRKKSGKGSRTPKTPTHEGVPKKMGKNRRKTRPLLGSKIGMRSLYPNLTPSRFDASSTKLPRAY